MGSIIARNKFTKKEMNFDGEIEAKESFEYGNIKSIENSKYGFKNLKGEWNVKPIYKTVSAFSGGVATVCFNTHKEEGGLSLIYGLIDRNGKYVLPLEYNKLSDPWHNSYEDEVSIAGSKKGIGYAIYNKSGKVIYGPIQKYKGKNILRLEPFKNDYFVIEYYTSKNFGTRHVSDGRKSVCDIVHRKGKVAVSENEFICQAVDENGYYGYINYNTSVAMIFSEGKTSGIKNKISGVSNVNGKNLFHQKNGAFARSYGSFDSWNFRENPKDPNKERRSHYYYKNLMTTDREVKNNAGRKTFEQDLIGKYTNYGLDITDVFQKKTFKIFSKTNGSVRDGRDVIRFNHYGADGKWAGTGLYSVSKDKLIYVDYTKTTIGNFCENRFFVPRVGYIVEKVK